MKTIKLLSLAMIAVAITGCDIYDDENTSPPNINVVVTSNHDESTWAPGTFDAGTGVWTVNTDSVCDAGTVHAVDNTLWVTFNKQMDPNSVQTAVDDCTPAGDWLTVSIPAPAGQAWYTCYSPASPTSVDGASVVIFLADDTGADGWAGAYGFPGDPTVATTYSFSGSILDQQGRDTPIDIDVVVAPTPCP